MKTAISIPDTLFKQAEDAAHKIGITRSKFFSLAIQDFLEKYHETSVTGILNKLYSTKDSSLDKKLGAMQEESIVKEKW